MASYRKPWCPHGRATINYGGVASARVARVLTTQGPLTRDRKTQDDVLLLPSPATPAPDGSAGPPEQEIQGNSEYEVTITSVHLISDIQAPF